MLLNVYADFRVCVCDVAGDGHYFMPICSFSLLFVMTVQFIRTMEKDELETR